MSPETLSVGVITTVVGMLVVFAILIFLALVTGLLARITGRKQKQKEAPAPAPVAAAPVEAAPADKIEKKTIAVIMAAISAATGKSAAQLKFTAIKRVHGAESAWANAGTAEIINTRQNYL